MSEVRRLKARSQGSKVLSEDSMRHLYSRACLGQAEVRRRGAGISDRHLEDKNWVSDPFASWLLALPKGHKQNRTVPGRSVRIHKSHSAHSNFGRPSLRGLEKLALKG